MKLAVVIAAYNRTGGLERVSVEYARGLRALGHDVTVFAQTVQRERADDGITFVRVGGVRGQMALRAATFPIAATHAMDGTNFDNIVAFGSVLRRPAVMREPGCHRSWWEFANATWPVTTFDGLRRRLNPHHRFVMAWDKRVLGRGIPRAVLAAGAWAADDIKRFYPAVSSKVSILPDGVNLDEFSFDPDGRDDLRKQWGSGPILFTVATELRRKGLGTLFEAFRLVRGEEPNAQLVVGGRVPEGDVRALAAHHRVHDAVRAVGFVRDLRAAYSAADAMVFPTMFDPWGLPVVEALACGTPVAASARAGASGVLIEGVTGTAIPDPTDAAVVASGILRALRLERDRERARASVEHLSWDTVVGDLERVCEETAG